jgi:DNA-directed RNA polymerase specialized sigma24 family protein
MSRPETRPWRTGSADPAEDQDLDLASLLALVARGDHRAFELVYGKLAGPVYGLVRQVVRDPAQSEEVAQEGAAGTAASTRSPPTGSRPTRS